MLLVRFAGEHAARKALAKSGSTSHKDENAPQVELFIEANEHGHPGSSHPKQAPPPSRSRTRSAGVFSAGVRLIVGFAAGDSGVLGALDSGLVTGILWGVFGAVAGALYGMWAGRGVSARRLKGLGAFVPPDTSLAVAWAEGSLSQETSECWAATGSERLTLRFNPVGHGAVLEV